MKHHLAMLTAFAVAACGGTGDNRAVRDQPSAAANGDSAPVGAVDLENGVATFAPAQRPGTSWRQRVSLQVAELEDYAPEVLARFSSIKPLRTRAGHLRFSTDAIHDPRAAAVFLGRLERGNEPAAVRAALAQALPRTGGFFADALVDLLDAETDQRVRAVLVASARRAPVDLALPALARGLRDASPNVRAEAAYTVSALPAGARLAGTLISLLADSAEKPRVAAAEALGVLRVARARNALAALLGDASSDVRLATLRALGQIDPSWIKGRPMLGTLAADSDPRIARLARHLARGDEPTDQ
ncbi:MAG: HEAT repeat domain-containing protein [Proteobacteria bacterium]|nr:HEAT repeat domain-containing protein [Pseudomonadota bacterium]